jgi:hypothetical protein
MGRIAPNIHTGWVAEPVQKINLAIFVFFPPFIVQALYSRIEPFGPFPRRVVRLQC